MVLVKRLKTKKEETVKHRTAPINDEVRLAREGKLAPFTRLVVEYLTLLKPEERLFKFGRSRAFQIVKHITGYWNHFFRANQKATMENMFSEETLSH